MFLKSRLIENAANVVESCVNLDDKTFSKAIGVLDARYHKPKLVITKLIAEIDSYLDPICRVNEKAFRKMVSNVKRCYDRIMDLDVTKILGLEGLTSNLHKCLPQKPWDDVGKLMISDIEKYTFSAVMKICENYIELLEVTEASGSTAYFAPRPLEYDKRPIISKSQSSKYQSHGKHQSKVYSAAESSESSESEYLSESAMTSSDHIHQVSKPSDRSFPLSNFRKSDSKFPKKSYMTKHQGHVHTDRGRSRSRSCSQFGSKPRSSNGGRSLSITKQYNCYVCKDNDHSTLKCTKADNGLLDVISTYQLCMICLTQGHQPDYCPLYDMRPNASGICIDQSCYSNKHNVKLCKQLRDKYKL